LTTQGQIMKNKTEMLNYCLSWYQTISGQSALKRLDELSTDVLSEIFGYYSIQIGALSGKYNLLKSSRITTDFSVVSQTFSTGQNNYPINGAVVSSIEQLPIATDNVDLVVASHVLELSDDPHQVLREIDRVLLPEGHCILIGFNPFLFSRLGRLIRSGFNRKNNIYKMRSVPRVRDWFSLLGFEVLDVHYMGVGTGSKEQKKNSFLKQWGNITAPVLSNMYVFHVKKQVVAMRPHKKAWKAPAVLSGGKVVFNRTAQKIRRENYSNL